MSRMATSLTYRKLINNSPDSLQHLREHSDLDLGGLEDDEWVEALATPKQIEIRLGFHLVQLKMLHRSYYACTTRVKMGRATDETGCRQCGQPVTFYHTISFGNSPLCSAIGSLR